jgi:hypothetical protein
MNLEPSQERTDDDEPRREGLGSAGRPCAPIRALI